MILSLMKFIAVIFCGLFVFSFSLLIKNTYIPKTDYFVTPGQMGIKFKECKLHTKDNIELNTWLIIKDKTQPTIILCHGLGSNMSDMLDFAKFLHDEGYNIFMFDFRGHGKSSGKISSFGFLEKEDLETVIEYLRDANEIINKNFGIFGISMGASVGIMVAPKYSFIKAIVADSSYSDIKRAIATHLKLIYHIPDFPFVYLAWASYSLRFSVNINKVAPLRYISKISPQAIFLIAGEFDQQIPPVQVELLYNAAKEPREIWIIPKAGHLEGYALAMSEYKKNVTRFFRKYLILETQEENFK